MRFWITLVRSVLALALGLALIVQPDKTRPILANFMGMFWLAAGVSSLRWGASSERPRRAARVAGIVGVVAGLLVLGRFLVKDVASEAVVVPLVGAVAVLTGVFHMLGGFDRERTRSRRRARTSLILGAFEIVLGALLLTSRLDRGHGLYVVAAAWAFAGAFMLLGDALRVRAHGRRPDSR